MSPTPFSLPEGQGFLRVPPPVGEQQELDGLATHHQVRLIPTFVEETEAVVLHRRHESGQLVGTRY